jgi:hypothetical protein
MTFNISKRYTVAKFAETYPNFTTPSSLRWLIFNADSNSMNKFDVIERIGRRVLINEANFFLWLESINNKEKMHG